MQTTRSPLLKTQSDLIVNLSLVGQKPTGLATYAANLVPKLALPDLTLLAPTGLEGSLLNGAVQNFSSYPIPANMSAENGKWGHLRRLLWTQFQLPQIYRDLHAELLFSPVPEAPLWSTCRSVVMVHDLIPLRFPKWTSPLTPYFRYYVPQVLAQAQHILCNSAATANEVVETFGIAAEKITPIPLAYDTDNFRFLDLPTQPYFMYLGRHDPPKNVQRLVSAFAGLRDRHHYELWLVGSIDRRYTPALMAQAAELGVGAQVKCLNYVPYRDLPQLLNQAIALIFPSLWEGFGFPVLEAMACGTPVVTSNLSALPEVAGDAAILVNPYQVDEITAAMQMLVQDGTVRSHLRAAGLERARQFRWEKTAEKTAAVLQQFL